jgi:hypothetical protein
MGLSLVVQDDILWFDVSVDDSLGSQVAKGFKQATDDKF